MQGFRHWIPDETTFESMGYKWSKIVALSEKEGNAIPEREPFPSVPPKSAPGKFANGALVSGSGGKVYVVLNNYRYWIPDPTTFNALGYQWNNIVTLSDLALIEIQEGTPFPSAAW
jgi:hypothetical protein